VPTPTLEQVLKERVAGLIGEDLEAVEAEIHRELYSPVPLIQEMGGYIARAGGKRLRPILLLLAARLAGYHGPRGVRLGCVVELLHTATLIHDDVVDQAPLRRGRPSANARWGDDASLLIGDHLYSKSFAMLVRDNDRAVMETLARSTVSMTEAEVFQLELKRSGFTSEADYLRIITQKTASFMSACCRIGGLLGGLPSRQVEALTRYGLDTGVAFQISDDSLDFVADPDRLGKAIGADLRAQVERLHSLPRLAERILAELKGGLAASDLATLHHASHTLKSCSAKVGASGLASRCEELEAMARTGSVPEAATLVEAISQEHLLVQAALISRLAQPKSVPAQAEFEKPH